MTQTLESADENFNYYNVLEAWKKIWAEWENKQDTTDTRGMESNFFFNSLTVKYHI